MDFTLACGQFVPSPGYVQTNVTTMCEQIAYASSRQAKLIVFPEMALSGYLAPEDVPPLALSLDSPEVRRLRDACKQYGIDAGFGLAEKATDGRIYNSMAYVDSSGKVLAVYRKTHLWDTEKQWAAPGATVAAFDTAQARCGMWICYDTRFPEVARLLAIDGATLALAATAWLGPADEWELALRARALDNGMYVAGSALQGVHPPFAFHGVSMIVDPHGHVIARAHDGIDQVITATYQEGVISAFRQRLPLLEQRRLDVCGRLLEASKWP